VWQWFRLLATRPIWATRFEPRASPLENYISWRDHSCNTLLSSSRLNDLWSLLPIHSVRLNAAQLALVLDCILRLSHLRVFGYPIFDSSAIPSSILRLSHLRFFCYPIFDSRLSHRQLSRDHSVFSYPNSSSRSDFGSCIPCLFMSSESSCCINHPGLIIRFRGSLVAGQCW
jgi:hypothetical protein